MSLVHWSQLFRSQTAPATILLVVVPFLLGGGVLFSWVGVVVLLFAWLVHLFSFGHNSLMDTQGGWDIEDKWKQHHPLVNGSISLGVAHNVVHSGVVLLGVLSVILAWCLPGNRFLVVVCFCLFVVTGHAYNDGMSKSTVWGFVPITISFMMLSLFGYYLVATKMNWLMLGVVVYFGLALMFLISYSGHLKEIETGGANLLRRLGARVEGGVFKPGVAGFYGWGVKVLNLLVIWYILGQVATCVVVWVVCGFLVVGILYLLVGLTTIRLWDRNRELRRMSLMEIATTYLLVVVLLPVIGYVEGVVLMVGGVVYFVVCNRLNWGTWLKPRV